MERFTSFDFGLSGLTALFHEDWIHTGEVEDVVYSYLSVGEDSGADELQRSEAAALGRDVAELAASSLSDGGIELLFSMSTSGNYCFRSGETGRTLLARIGAACQEWEVRYGCIPLEVDDSWSSQSAVSEVCDVIASAPLRLPGEFIRYFGSDVSELRDALDACVRSASVDLAFRLFLRIHVANFIPVDRSAWVRYEMVARQLELGEDLISSLGFLSPGIDSGQN